MSPDISATKLVGLREFVVAVTREGRGRLVWVIAVQAVSGLGQAAGVLLLIPLLGAIGVGTSRGIARWMRHAFLLVGLKPTLGVVLIAYVALTAINAGLSAYQSVLTARYRLEFVNRLRGRLFGAVAAAEWRHLMGIRRTDLLAVLTANVMMVGTGVVSALNIVVAVILVAAQLAAAVQISPPMTGLALASGIVLVLVVWPLVGRSRQLGAKLVKLNRDAMRLASQFLDALKLAKAYGREREHQLAYMAAISEARDAQVSFAWASGIAGAVQGTMTAGLLGLTVFVAVRVVHVPVGSLLVVSVVFTRVVNQITSSQSSFQQVAQALPAYEEVSGMIAGCEAAVEFRGLGASAIHLGSGVQLEDVSFAYPNTSLETASGLALRRVSLALPRGSTVALAGPSGAGKTTVADMVAGLIVPSAGRVVVGGRALTPERLPRWRKSIALVPQDPFLFHDTILANLRWARPEASEAELWEALRVANAAEFVGELPAALETVVGERGTRLSGGERQRLALARALLRKPELLILDEATSSLDTENELAIRRALTTLHGRTTILLIAHRLSTISEADEVVVLDRGEVVERGTWTDLVRLEGRLQALVTAGATP